MRKSFEDVLEDILEDGDGLIDFEDTDAGPVRAAPGVYPDFQPVGAFVPPASLTSAYAPEQELQPERQVDPLEAAKVLLREIRPDLSRRALTRLRRNFAAAHHPDRVPPDLREAAQAAMALVNGAIDAALKATRLP